MNKRKLKSIIAKLRAGHDPDTKQLHITDTEALEQIEALYQTVNVDDELLKLDQDIRRVFMQFAAELNHGFNEASSGETAVDLAVRDMRELLADGVMIVYGAASDTLKQHSPSNTTGLGEYTTEQLLHELNARRRYGRSSSGWHSYVAVRKDLI